MNKDDFRNLNFSLLGKNSQLDGNFNFKGDTIINCSLKGTINIIDQGKLTLERDSDIEANIFCQDIDIFGNFSGSINASGTLCIRSSANVSGKIDAKNLSIFPGAQINMHGDTNSNQEL